MNMTMTKHATLATQLGEQLKHYGLLLAVAESCTGGGLAATLTSVPGSSAWFDRGFVTYSNDAKHEMLGVPPNTLRRDGAVSEATARTMAEGCINNSAAELSVAITGIAGPDGGTKTKPVGTVWIACAGARLATTATCYYFEGDREAVRKAAELKALEILLERVQAMLSQTNIQEPTYFFALMPDNATAEALHQHARAFTEHTPCKPTPRENLHLTLAYLGKLDTTELTTLKNIQLSCPTAPFELNIAEAEHWSELKLTYLSPKPLSKPLEQLHDFLNQHMLQQGFKPERRVFIPHITLARHDSHALKAHRIEALPWFIHEFCLVQSTPTTAKQDSSNYRVIQRWPLRLT